MLETCEKLLYLKKLGQNLPFLSTKTLNANIADRNHCKQDKFPRKFTLTSLLEITGLVREIRKFCENARRGCFLHYYKRRIV